MRTWFLRHRQLHIWLLAALALLGSTYLVRGSGPLANALADGIITPLRQALGRLCYRAEISVMEILWVLAALAALAYIVWSAAAVIRARGRRWDRIYSAVLGALDCALSLYVLFWFLWGIYFWTDSFQERSGLYAQPVALEELRAVTEDFARQLAEAADQVPRDREGCLEVSWREVVDKSPEVYRGIEEEYPFLAFADQGVKPMAFSRLMSRMDFTGFYCAYTGEANVNVDSPVCMLPATVAHELGHQRGFASEQECNFLGVLAAIRSGDPVYAYSGWLTGYVYLGNALYREDPESYWAIRNALPETVRADLRENNAYWERFRGSVAQTVSNKVYDGLLKAYGDERGIQSYGTVVDLLVAYSYRS